MNKSLTAESDPPDHIIEEGSKLSPGNDDAERVDMRLEGQVGNGKEVNNVTTTTMTIGSTTTGDFVQLTPELLTQILTNMDDPLDCRQVNKTWALLISSILRKRKCNEIFFDGASSVSKFRISSMVPLNDCLKNSKKLFGSLDSFPCTRFRFLGVSLEEEYFPEFFDLFGPSIRSLKLCEFFAYAEDGQLKSLNRLLTHQAPNIKSLTVEYLEIRPGGVPVVLFDDNQTKLPSLQRLGQGRLYTEQEEHVFEEIIGAANNLQVYKLLEQPGRLDPLIKLRSKGKIHTLEKVDLSKLKVTVTERRKPNKTGRHCFICPVNHRFD